MTDAEIVIGIRGQTEGGKVVKRTLDDIGASGRKAQDGAKGLEGQLKSLDGVGRSLAGALKGVVVAFGLRELQQAVDTYTNIQNRLKLVTDTSAELLGVTKELFAISNETRQSFASTAEVYARTALATKEMGLSQQETLEFTRSLNQAVILSGASATESAAGLIQLSQGLASGALRGDELRSVLEQLPAVADVISSSLGVTRGELRQMGQDGKITADVVIEAFQKAKVSLDASFGETVPTISQSLTILMNNFLEFIGQLDSATGISTALANAIIFVGEGFSYASQGVKLFSESLQAIINTVVTEAIVKIDSLSRSVTSLFGLLGEGSSLSGLTEEELRGSSTDTLAAIKNSQPTATVSSIPKKRSTPVASASDLDEVNKKIKTAKETLPEVDENMKRLIQQTDRFADSASDAFGDFITGSKSAKEALGDLLKDMAKLFLQQGVTSPLSDALRGVFSGGGGGGGLLSGISGAFSGGGIFGGISKAFGFASGGSMVLGGNGGVDNNLLSLNNQPIANVGRGEVLSISPDQKGGGAAVVVNQTINVSTGVQQTVRAEMIAMLPEFQNRTIAAVNDARLRGY